MGDPARKRVAEEGRVRRVLSRVLAPGLVKATLEEIFDVPPEPERVKSTPEEIERARAMARIEAKR